MYYLKKAIHYFNEKNIRIIIIEGQYNPLAYKAENLKLNKEVRKLLTEFLTSTPENIYIPREDILNFDPHDYRDGYHVKEKAGLKFVINLIKKLDDKGL